MNAIVRGAAAVGLFALLSAPVHAQVLRQLAWALPRDHHVAQAYSTAISLINRDEVDAERQLQVR